MLRSRGEQATPVLVALATLLSMLHQLSALNNGVGRTPAMGWNSWNGFRCQINESLIREVADAMVASGLRDAGYKYVNIDDCWMETRGPDGAIVPFKDKFPSGMKALADYVHSKGLLFGVYSDTGNHTCEGYPGSWGHEAQDAQTYASWGVDYLKYDYCGMEKTTVSVQASYEKMRDALNATGRPILYSLCSWGSGQPHLWGKGVGNSWRVGIDVFAAWDADHAKQLLLPNFLQPIMGALQAVEPLAEYAGPGGFNDPDMLVVGLDGMFPYGIVQTCPAHVKGCKPGDYISRDRWGRVGGLTATEQRAHFAFWCMLSAPLILGNDPRRMTKTTRDILMAPEILAISQDPLSLQARKVWSQGSVSIWVKPLASGRTAALLFNAGPTATDISLMFSRDLPELAKQWARDIPGLDPVCVDKSEADCKTWAAAGECAHNSGFMMDHCRASCPEACPRPLGPPGPKATALVRDAWQRDDLGPSVAQVTAHLVEPHEARVLVLQFVEPEVARAWSPPASLAAEAAARKDADGSAVKALGRRGKFDADATKEREAAAAASVKELKRQVAFLSQQLERVQLEAKAHNDMRSAEEKAEDAEIREEAAILKQDADDAISSSDAVGLQAQPASLLRSKSGQLLLTCNAVTLAVLAFVVLRRGSRGVSAGQKLRAL